MNYVQIRKIQNILYIYYQAFINFQYACTNFHARHTGSRACEVEIYVQFIPMILATILRRWGLGT